MMRGLVSIVLMLAAAPAAAQQGSLQMSASAQTISGETRRYGTVGQVEPDLSVTWLQPGTRFGTINLEVHGTERNGQFHAGRMYGSLRDLKAGAYSWTVEAGDAYYSPTIGEYRFSNLSTPIVTFAGGAVSARSARTSFGVVAGQGTIWRNVFGSDPDTLDQTLFGGRASHRPTDRLELTARASRIRTTDLSEYSYSIAASDQAGGGARYQLSSTIQMVADGSVVSYRRAGSTTHERDGSGLVGLHWLHGRGWLQVNASRFSPGDTPTINSALPDRSGAYVAGEYDLVKRIRVFGGWEAFRQNLDPSAALAAGYAIPRSDGTRQYGGVRWQVGSRSNLTFRGEAGDRISKYVSGRQDVESDTGVWSADWQTSFARASAFLRYAERSDVTSASRAGSYAQRDIAGQLFYRMSTSAQLFGSMTSTYTTDQAGGGSNYWQATAGTQLQVFRQGLWFRSEGSMSRNADLVTLAYIPRESLSVGFNGHVTPRLSLGVDAYLDRATPFSATNSPWATRWLLRAVHTLPTGTPIVPGSSGLFRTAPVRAVATVKGIVFTDWNGNGLQDPGEGAVAGIPLRLEAVGAAESSKNGEFIFKNVPDGLHEVGLDVGSLPIDFDAPAISRLQIALSGHDTRQVAFGLIPLGSIRGRIVRDLNNNGVADTDEPIVDNAVVVLDGGKRSEQARRGRYAFEAVQSGEHTVTLLAESLPEGAMVAGEATRVAALGRDRMTLDIPFAVSLETRPEIRKAFPAAAARVPPRAAPPRRDARPATPAVLPEPAPARSSAPSPVPSLEPSVAAAGTYTLQVAAFDDPIRAREMVADLKRKGLAAYLVEPPPSQPNAPYRVAVGAYASRLDAERAASSVGKVTGVRVWVRRY